MPRRKLTEDQVRAIRRDALTGRVPQKVLAIDYGVSESAISCIVAGKRYKHVK